MNHRLRICIYTLLAVALALIASGEQVSLAEGTTIFVDADATGANNGSSWSDAFTTLQPALDAAVSGDQIWVAEGIYKPTAPHGGTTERYKSFQMKNGVAIYGGFAGSEFSLEERDWVSHATILSGDLGIEGDTADNSYQVFYHPLGTALDSSAILDGFTVTGGNANGGWLNGAGGGMYNEGSSPTLANCTFVENSAFFGGGMYNDGSSPTLIDCVFLDNSANNHGGGMYNSASSPILSNVTFAGNWTSTFGGGMHNNYYSSPMLTGCIFMDNTANDGGGVYNYFYSSPVLINCTFWDNSVLNQGGGMYNDQYASPVLTNCTFSHNSAAYRGGGIFNYNSSPILTNSILWRDTPEEIFNYDAGSVPTVNYSDVFLGYWGDGNINLDPLFLDPLNGNLHLNPESPAIDAGTDTAPYLPLYDFEGDVRILDGDGDGTAIVDMGADEAIYEAPPLVEVTIDIKPATLQNNIRLTSRGTLPVAILTTSEVDATNINPETVLFVGAVPVKSIFDDIDHDGDIDLVLYFKIQDLALDEYSTEATLTGEFYDGMFIQGTDTVNIIP